MKPLTVLITGAAGNIGGKLRAYLTQRGGYALRLIDIAPGNDASIVGADLAHYDEDWVGLFAGVDVVVHLAAYPKPNAAWENVMGPNIDGVLHVFHAAARHGVRRVVFASSIWATEGRFRDDAPIEAGDPCPGIGSYGLSKAFGERVAKEFALVPGQSSISLRIGYCRAGENPPGSSRFPWENEVWLSNRDLCQGMERAIISERTGFCVVNLMSANRDMRWTLTAARECLGYEPEDGYVPLPPSFPALQTKTAPDAAKVRKGLFARLFAPRRPV